MIDAARVEELGIRYPGRVHARARLVDVTPMQEPDPDWSYTDVAGHTHRWVAEDGQPLWWGATIPTVKRVVTGHHWCEDCQDEHEEAELRCVECGEVIRPRQVSAVVRRQIVYGYDVDPIEFNATDGVLDEVAGTFATPVGDVFRVYSVEETWPGVYPARVCVIPA